MSRISAVILAKNEEEMIADCLDSVSFCDEILVIDSHSTDRTAEIASYKGAKVYEYITESFADRRNYGLELAKHDWILYVDADERVGNELKDAVLKAVKDEKSAYHAYKVKRKNYYYWNHEWPYVETLERLFRKKYLNGWKGVLHETPKITGSSTTLEGYLLHYSHRNLSQMLQKTIEWSGFEADLRFKAHHPKVTWWRFARVMLTAFYDSYIHQKGYKAGTAGIVESIYQAFSMFITYAKLWEMQQKK